MPVDAERDQVAGAHRGACGDELLLGDVPDAAVAAAHGMAVQLDGSGVERLLTEDRLEEAGLARAVRSEHGDELAGVHVEVESAPQGPLAEAERGGAQTEDDLAPLRCGHPLERLAHFESAAPTASRLAFIQPT